MKSLKIIIGVIIIAAIVFVLYYKTEQRKNSAISIAANLPLTGGFALYGQAFKNGLDMSYEENKNKIKPVSVTFDWGDNRFSTAEAVSIMEKQLLNNPTIYTSALVSQVKATEKKISESNIPNFVWIFDRKVRTENTKNNFRTWVSYQQEANMFLQYIKSKNYKKVALLVTKTSNAMETYASYVPSELKKNPEIEVFLETFENNARTDTFTNIVTKLNDFNPEAVIITAFIPQMVNAIQILRSFDIDKSSDILVSMDILDALSTLPKADIDELIVAAPNFLVKPSQAEKDWMVRYQERFGKKPSYHSAFAYDMGLVIFDAASRLKLPATNQEWIDAIEKTKIEGITGNLSFDKDGSINPDLTMSVIINGVLDPLSN